MLHYKAWGDEKFGDEEEDYESPVDENGIKYSVQFRLNEAGKKIRITRKIRVTKRLQTVNKRVEERKQRWKKFGRVAGVEGIEPGATYRGEEVFLVMGEEGRAEQERREQEKKDKKEIEDLYQSLIVEGRRPRSTTSDQPVALWRPTTVRSGTTTTPDNEEATTTILRIGNLSEETTEDDLREMVRDFGRITRMRILRDRESNRSRGLAFITFHLRRDAELAMKHLNGRGYDHSILCVEWAQPAPK